MYMTVISRIIIKRLGIIAIALFCFSISCIQLYIKGFSLSFPLSSSEVKIGELKEEMKEVFNSRVYNISLKWNRHYLTGELSTNCGGLIIPKSQGDEQDKNPANVEINNKLSYIFVPEVN